MNAKSIVIFNSKDAESLKKKFKAKQEQPKATFVDSSNKKALKEALKGNKENVVNLDDKLDLRKLKGDKVVKGKKPTAPKKKPAAKKVVKKAAPKKKAVAKKTAKKKAAPKKKK